MIVLMLDIYIYFFFCILYSSIIQVHRYLLCYFIVYSLLDLKMDGFNNRTSRSSVVFAIVLLWNRMWRCVIGMQNKTFYLFCAGLSNGAGSKQDVWYDPLHKENKLFFCVYVTIFCCRRNWQMNVILFYILIHI